MAGLSNLIPLIVLLVIVGVGGFIGYQMYVWSGEVKERANRSMEKRNMGFTKEGGLRVGVKGMEDESYADKTQNVLVNVWNNAELPNYKSRLGWNSTQKKASSSSSSPNIRPSTARTSSGRSAAASGTTLSPPEHKSSQKRSASPVPGAW